MDITILAQVKSIHKDVHCTNDTIKNILGVIGAQTSEVPLTITYTFLSQKCSPLPPNNFHLPTNLPPFTESTPSHNTYNLSLKLQHITKLTTHKINYNSH